MEWLRPRLVQEIEATNCRLIIQFFWTTSPASFLDLRIFTTERNRWPKSLLHDVIPINDIADYRNYGTPYTGIICYTLHPDHPAIDPVLGLLLTAI